ncbi:hypothetical protein BTI47_08110 [Lactobacillus delbrueckii subsp. bulgaricus]|nr:hypothetical protein [Lactobacillus delbrueckii subsp. bulgaricus]MBT8986477.1 hypothetical protein [Lactobacillus delbrueckii subsp. bulgaricus]
MYKMPFIGYLPARLSKETIATPLQILIIYFGLNSTQFERIKNIITGLIFSGASGNNRLLRTAFCCI